jgi:hypothetical protein
MDSKLKENLHKGARVSIENVHHFLKFNGILVVPWKYKMGLEPLTVRVVGMIIFYYE